MPSAWLLARRKGRYLSRGWTSVRRVGSISSAITPTTPVGWSCPWRSISARPFAATGAATMSCCNRMRAPGSRDPHQCFGSGVDASRVGSLRRGRRCGVATVAWLRGRDHDHAAVGRGPVVERRAGGCGGARRRRRTRPATGSAAVPAGRTARGRRAVRDHGPTGRDRGGRGPRAVDRLSFARTASGRIPDDVAMYAVHCGEQRRLAGSAYADAPGRLCRGRSHRRSVAEADADGVAQIADERVGGGPTTS